MEDKPKILINKAKDRRPQCNFCLSRERVYHVKGDRLTAVMSICTDCMTKISDKLNSL